MRKKRRLLLPRFALAALFGGLLPACLAPCAAHADDPSDAIFDEAGPLKTVRLTMADPADWQRLVDHPLENTVYRCTFEWNAELLENVGVRAKGQSSREAGTKPAVRFLFNHYRDEVGEQAFRGLTKLDAQAMKGDPSMMRERLVYNLCTRRGLPAPRALHVRLEVDGAYRGLYLILEQWDQPLALRLRFPDHRGNLFKFVAHERGDVMVWDGEDPAQYLGRGYQWERRRTSAPDDLIETLRVINGPSDAELLARLPQVLDLDELLEYCAVCQCVVDEDWLFTNMIWEPEGGRRGFYYNHNSYWYHEPASGRMKTLIWDTDAVMKDAWTPEGRWVERDLFLGFEGFLLTRRIFRVPAWRSDFLGKVRALVDGAFAPAAVVADLDRIYDQIRAAAADDPFRPYSEEEFQAEVATLRRDLPLRAENIRQQLARQ